MNDASCTHPKVRYGDNLFTSPTPVSWACLDCGARGMAEIVEYLELGELNPSALGHQLSAIGSELSYLSDKPLANMSPRLSALGHRLMALGLWLRSPNLSK